MRRTLATRLLIVFAVALAAPAIAIGTFALRAANQRLEADAAARMQQAAEQVALATFDWLEDAEAALRTTTDAGARPFFDGVANVSRETPRSAASVIEPIQTTPAWMGDDLVARIREQRDDRQLFELPQDGFALAVAHGREADHGWRVGRLRMGHLLEQLSTLALPPEARACVASVSSLRLRCASARVGSAQPAELSIDAPTRNAMSSQVAGTSTFMAEGQPQLTGFYRLFLKATHAHDHWTFAVVTPLSATAGALSDLAARMAAAALVAWLVTGSLAFFIVQRRLAPLSRLSKAMRRLAEGNLEEGPHADDGDEFVELTDSFGEMHDAVSARFDALSRMLDIDREILSTLEPGAIARTLASRIGEVFPCAASAVFLNQLDDFDGPALFLCDEHRVRATRVSAPEGWIAEVGDGEEPEPLPTAAEQALAPLLALTRCVRAVPLCYGDGRVGVLAVGVREAADWPATGWEHVRQVADQAGVALATAAVMQRNERLANYDQLTGQPNRLLFAEKVRQGLAEAVRGERMPAAIYMIDLDDFKRVNDTLGHHAGDQLLCAMAARLGKALPNDLIARLGGDEFACYVPRLTDSTRALHIAETLVQALREPVQLRGQEILVSGSIGVSIWPDDGESLDVLLKNADTAMYAAKAEGKNVARFFTRSMNERMEEQMRIESGLRRALENGELELYYQPIVEVATRECIGAEALLRWFTPDGRMISPATFIPVAEETGMIVEMGEWILETACREASRWAEITPERITVSVNLAARQFSKPGLAAVVKRAVGRAGLPCDRLTLELTETTLMSPNEVVSVLSDLRRLGMRVSIDDFGTGYSSLAYLKQFPVDYLKLDQSFTRGVTDDADDAAIAEAIIAMADSMGLGVIAEGVETEEQLAFLAERGCHAAQGYLFAKPVPAEEFRKLLAGPAAL